MIVDNLFMSADKFPLIQQSCYPYLPLPTKQYVNDFINSKEKILFFIGVPGTGKTTYIREIINQFNSHYNGDCHLSITSNHHALMSDQFVGTLSSKVNKPTLIVIEDADQFVKKRELNNGSMSSLLNITDGVVENNIKFVISTNLSSLKDVDEALLRPGRTYDIHRFRSLTCEEVINVRKDMGLTTDIILDKEDYTLAQAINNVNRTINNKIGF
jgi:ATP-dependent 26S proteasome regulatory subunit